MYSKIKRSGRPAKKLSRAISVQPRRAVCSLSGRVQQFAQDATPRAQFLLTVQAVADIICSTLGPRSMLKMLLDPNGGVQFEIELEVDTADPMYDQASEQA